jgi:tripartite-type tricarboxylate transporter receptor subunit TctC
MLQKAVLLAAALVIAPAFAQSYPAKPVRIVVPYAAGGPLDDVARYLGQKLTGRWGQPVLVDNRGGSGGAVGAELVVKSPPDGYTLLLGNGGPITTINVARHKNRDFLVPVIGARRTERLIDAVWKIERMSDMRKLRPYLTLS